MGSEETVAQQINKAIVARDLLNKNLNDLLAERDALGYTEKITVLRDRSAILEAVENLLDERHSVALIVVQD